MADERKKRLPPEALGLLAREEIATGGPLLLDKITYAQLRDLRNNDDFQESLRKLDEEWRHCYNYNFFLRTLKRHVDLIYQLLDARKRASRVRRDGPSITVEVSKNLEQSHAIVEGLGLNITAIKFLPVWVVIKNLYSWSKPSGLQRDLYELADRVGDKARKQVGASSDSEDKS